MKHCPHAVPDCHVCKPHIQRFSELEEMNAGLRALNHEVLAALEAALPFVKAFEQGGERVQAKVRAAIAKARGEIA